MDVELKEKVARLLEKDHLAVLSTYGPSGVQAGQFPCQFYSHKLYFLIPSTTDLVDNLEECSDVLATTSEWQLRGSAQVCEVGGQSPNIELLKKSDAIWCRLIEIIPKTVQITSRDGWGYAETIDFE